MCVAVPGIVREVNGPRARVDFSGNIVEAQTGLVSVQPGDAVLVHAGCILQVLSPFDRDMLMELLDELEQAAQE